MLPAFLGHGSGKVFGGLGSSVLGYFFGAPVSESKRHQRLDILRHFYEEFNDPVWIPFRGTLLGVLPRTKDPIFHGGFVACLHRSAFVSMSLH